MNKFFLSICIFFLLCNTFAQPFKLSSDGDSTTVPASPVPEVKNPNSPLEDIISYRNNPKYWQVAQSVGLLEIVVATYTKRETYACTATLIHNDYILTNYHCLQNKEYRGQVVAAMLKMGYDNQTPQVTYPVNITPIEVNYYLDYAILYVGDSPGQRWGHVTWNVRPPRQGERVFIIQHPKGESKQISKCSLDFHVSSTSPDIIHRCSTFFGSSGSLVISEETNELLALHFAGQPGQEYNYAKNLEQIERQSSFIQRNILPTVSTVEELISRAQQGGILKLAATTFHLNSTLELAGDVQLIGHGSQQTRIVSDAANYIMHYRGGGTLSIEGIGIEHRGSNEASILKVDDGTLEIDDGQFLGANRGSGLVIAGNTSGTVKNSLFISNGLHGIAVTDNTQLTLENNRLHDNGNSGIDYTAFAGGSAIDNYVYLNGLHGISVNDNARPRIDSNLLFDNEQDGIAYADSAGGSAINNKCYNAKTGNGISVSDRAQPIIQGNRLYDNFIGIAYSHESGGLIKDNEIYSNVYGIYLARSVKKSLTFGENVISGNGTDVYDEREY